MKPARRARNGFDSRYLVYLNNRAAGKGSVKTIDLCDQKTAPLTPKSFIYNRRSYSQAGHAGSSPVSRSMFSITSATLAVARYRVFEVTRRSTDFQPINTAWV